MTRSPFRVAVTASSLAVAACGVSLGTVSAAQAATPTLFGYTGAEQTFTVPAGVTSVDVAAIGGRGGAGASSGGFGSSVGAIIPVTPGQVLYVEVGGNADNSATPAFGGGGVGGTGGVGHGGGGGGASDVQTLSGFGASALASRLVVAGGGGGGGGRGEGTVGGAGGNAGSSLTATAPIEPGQAGGPAAGGTGGTGGFGGADGSTGAPGGGGSGGAGGADGSGGGGGGGGWYGGGGGGGGGGVPTNLGNNNGAGAGGGSNFVADGGASSQIGVDSTGVPSVTITPEAAVGPTTPTLTLISSQNPAVAGTPVTFSASLSPAPACGTVNWVVDSVPAATTVVPANSNGMFTLGPVNGLTVGTHTVAVSYSGCATSNPANGSLVESISPATSGSGPSITATSTSSLPKHGHWYRTPVTVSFTCRAGSAPLATQCPGPVTLSKSELHESVTATISDSANRKASVTVTVNIDRVAPTLRVTGAANGTTYRSTRHLKCHASDILSGVSSCVIHKSKSSHGGVTRVRWTAKATDVAGNSTKDSGAYRVD